MGWSCDVVCACVRAVDTVNVEVTLMPTGFVLTDDCSNFAVVMVPVDVREVAGVKACVV